MEWSYMMTFTWNKYLQYGTTSTDRGSEEAEKPVFEGITQNFCLPFGLKCLCDVTAEDKTMLPFQGILNSGTNPVWVGEDCSEAGSSLDRVTESQKTSSHLFHL